MMIHLIYVHFISLHIASTVLWLTIYNYNYSLRKWRFDAGLRGVVFEIWSRLSLNIVQGNDDGVFFGVGVLKYPLPSRALWRDLMRRERAEGVAAVDDGSGEQPHHMGVISRLVA